MAETTPPTHLRQVLVHDVPDHVTLAYRKGHLFVCPYCGGDKPKTTKTIGGVDRHVDRMHPSELEEFRRRKRAEGVAAYSIAERYPQLKIEWENAKASGRNDFPPHEVHPAIVRGSLTAPPTTPPEPTPPGRLTVMVADITGDKATVEAALQQLLNAFQNRPRG